MSVEPIGLLFILFGLLILQRGPVFGIYLLVPSMVLGSCAALIVANATIQPSHLLLVFMTMAIISQPGTWTIVIERLTFPREGFWLVATALYGVIGAFILPRFFAGATYVVAVGSASSGTSLILVPLTPTSGNLTQSIYFLGDVVFFFICYIVAQSRQGLEAITNAILIYSSLNVFFAFVDLATYWTGTGFLLDFMRNSTYSMQDEIVINGLKRINGSFTEASSFAASSLWVGCFTFRLWLGGIRPHLSLVLSLANMVLVVFCTSTTGYVTLPAMLGILYMTSLLRMMKGGRLPSGVYGYLALAPLMLILLVTVVMLTPALADPVMGMIRDMVLNKGTSSSAVERGMWNRTAMNAFLATNGLGAGIGTVRASSFPVAVLANLGAVGGLAYWIFILMGFFKPAGRPLDWTTLQIRAAARTGCLVSMLVGALAGTVIDLGLPYFMMAGLACAASDFRPRAKGLQA